MSPRHYLHVTMQKQPIHCAISTADLISGLDFPPEEPKATLRDMLTSTGQVATVLSLCWMLHVVF